MNIIDLDGITEKKPAGKKEAKPLISRPRTTYWRRLQLSSGR